MLLLVLLWPLVASFPTTLQAGLSLSVFNCRVHLEIRFVSGVVTSFRVRVALPHTYFCQSERHRLFADLFARLGRASFGLYVM